MLAAEAATEAAVFEWTIETKVGIVTAGFMSPPCAVALDMRNLPVFSLRLFPARFRHSLTSRSRSVLRNVSPTHAMSAAAMSAAAMPATS